MMETKESERTAEFLELGLSFWSSKEIPQINNCSVEIKQFRNGRLGSIKGIETSYESKKAPHSFLLINISEYGGTLAKRLLYS